jgi:MerR family transcriptional regulator/heat shock protein HspR
VGEPSILPMSEDPVIPIGVLAKRVGLSVSTVRKSENEGLVIAHRTPSGHRRFSYEDIARVRAIHRLLRHLRMNIESIRRMQALIPCWDLRPCDAATRSQCAAYEEQTRPCWMVKGSACAVQGNECRRCMVYRFGSLCTEEIKHLMHDPSEIHDTGMAIRTLLERRRNLHTMES